MFCIEVKFLNTVYGFCKKSILPLPFYPILISIPLPLSFTLGTLQTHLTSKINARAILQSCSSLYNRFLNVGCCVLYQLIRNRALEPCSLKIMQGTSSYHDRTFQPISTAKSPQIVPQEDSDGLMPTITF